MPSSFRAEKLGDSPSGDRALYSSPISFVEDYTSPDDKDVVAGILRVAHPGLTDIVPAWVQPADAPVALDNAIVEFP